jgi:hypothetical protein
VGSIERVRGRTTVGIVAVACAFALPATTAWAATATVGQLFVPNETSCSSNFTYLQIGVGSGASYVVPAAGVVTSWSFWDNAFVVPGLKLKVARDAQGLSYSIVGEATAGTQLPSTINAFSTHIPVEAGDVIGIYEDGGGCGSNTTDPADVVVDVTGDQPLGTTAMFSGLSGSARFPVEAKVVLQPGVNSISPAAGPTGGGAKVSFSGHDFSGATAVRFGAQPARTFTVESDSLISAVTPSATAGTVDVTVTSPGGKSPTSLGDRFTFKTRCRVPKLKGKRLKSAKLALIRSLCRLGKVRGPRTGKVVHQSRKPGAHLPVGTKINIRLR